MEVLAGSCKGLLIIAILSILEYRITLYVPEIVLFLNNVIKHWDYLKNGSYIKCLHNIPDYRKYILQ